jgi:hypothetical protein
MAAQEQLPAEGTLFWVMEYRDPQGAEFPDRPAIFDLDPATLASYECSVAPSYLIRFQDAGRFFQAHVAFGPDASDSLGPEVLRALESLDVIAPVPEGCPAGTGPWSDPACPQPTWVRAVIDRAGYEVIDDTGSAFEARAPDLGSEFYIHTTDEPEGAIFRGTLRQEGYRLALTIDGIDVYSDGERQVWTVQGLHVWISGAPVDTPGPVIEKLVRASTAIYYEAIDTRP